MEAITGANAIREILLKPGNLDGCTLYILSGGKGKAQDLESLAFTHKGLRVVKTDSQTLDRISASNKGAALICPKSLIARDEYSSVSDFCNRGAGGDSVNSLVVILDSVTDPQNLGAIIRTADCFSADLVVVQKRRAAGFLSSAFSVSQGAMLHIPLLQSVNLSRDIAILKERGFWIYALDAKGGNIHNAKFASKSVLVLGSEGFGIRSLVKKSCDMVLSIPIKGHVDSLNVSAAAAIAMSEYRRVIGY